MGRIERCDTVNCIGGQPLQPLLATLNRGEADIELIRNRARDKWPGGFQ